MNWARMATLAANVVWLGLGLGFGLGLGSAGCRSPSEADGTPATKGDGEDGSKAPRVPSRRIGRGIDAPDVPAFPTADVQIAQFPDGPNPGNPVFSVAGQRVAWIGRTGVPAIDGVDITGLDRSGPPRFSPNGQYAALVGSIGLQEGEPGGASLASEDYIIIGDERLGPYQRAKLLHVYDDGRVQFIAGRTDQRAVFENDVPGPTFQRIDRLDLVRAVPDGVLGPVVAYRASRIDEQCVVVHGSEQCYASVGRPVLSPDRTRTAHTATKARGSVFTVLDGTASEAKEPYIDWRVAVPNAGPVAYAAQTDGEGRSVVSGQTRGKPYDRVVHLTVTPDGSTYAYAARVGKKWRLVVGTEEHKPVDGEIKEIVLGPGGKRWALVVRTPEGETLVTADNVSPRYADVAWVALSDDGTSVAYVGNDKDRAVAVVDGVVSDPYDEIGDIRFGDDKRWSYIARKDAQWWLVTRDATWGPYDDIGAPKILSGVRPQNYTLSDDGKHLVFRARNGDRWQLVVDGVATPAHDHVWGDPFAFDAAGTRVGYFAATGKQVWWRMADVPPS